MAIKHLDRNTVEQIAAGEVIERPAAVVKELVENALDAGATRIDVSINEGGIDLIEVRDNGIGIATDELPAAVERHATSKLSDIDDLLRLHTLGFRGEALSSVAAVSDLHIKSIESGKSVGGELRVRFGEVGQAQLSSWGAGTAITARQLFANVPARREFLRSPATESNYVRRIISAYAIGYPDVAISLHVDGRRVLATDGSGDRLQAVAAIWGIETARQMVELQMYPHEHEGYAVAGVISLPSIDRARRDQQALFVQGRLIQSNQLSVAFEQAYSTLLMVGRRPIGCILISTPGDRLDVNVHPTKREVRFADERLVFALVQRSVRHTLIEEAHEQPVTTIVESPLAPSQSWAKVGVDPATQRRLTLADPRRIDRPRPELADERPRDDAETDLPSGVATSDGDTRAVPVLRVLGQVASMFITAEGPDGLYLIDQHAADERIQFERIMREYTSRQPAQQTLLAPVVVELTADQYEMWERSSDELAGLGFDTREFGGSSVAVHAIPAILKLRDPAKALMTILDEMLEGGRGDSRLESLAISAACHASIRAGQALSLIEMRELVNQLEQCSSPLACGHGRPTIIRMSADDLARQFSRR